jgi:hypothetical protein
VKASRCTFGIAVLLVAGCASVEETAHPAETSPRPSPPRVVPSTAQVPKPVPPAQVALIAPPPQVAELPRATEVETLIGEFARLRKLQPAELAREQDVARQVFSQSRTDSARIRFAMALAIPGAPGTDDARALDVLEPLVKTPGASLHPLAFMIASYIQEQRRLALQLAGLQQNVQGLQQNVQGLQQKLDAIKTLERSLSGRGIDSGTPPMKTRK